MTSFLQIANKRLAIFVAMLLLLLAYACSGSNTDEGLCDPGSEIFCRCPGGGESGTKRCNDDGQSFSECRLGPSTKCDDRPGNGSSTTSSSGNGSSSSSSGGTGDLPLYAYCKENSECMSGLCPMSYCTKKCKEIEECLPNAECVQLDGEKRCRPKCKVQQDCDKYMLPSQCGFALAIDDWGVAICANWEGALAFPPEGYECQQDVDCNLGHNGVGRVCGKFTSVCVAGCYSESDCPTAKSCSEKGGLLGTCQ